MKIKSNFRELAQVYSLLGKNKVKYFITILVTCFAYPAMNILFSFAYKQAVNAIEFNEYRLFWISCLLFCGAVFVQCVLEPFSNYKNAVIVNKTLFDIRCKTFKHVMDLPLSYFEDNESADLNVRLTNNIDAFEPIYRGQFRDLMTALVWGIGALASMIHINYRMAICAVALSMVAYVANRVYIKPMKTLNNEVQTGVDKVNEKFALTQNAINVARYFCKGFVLTQQFDGENRQLKEKSIKTGNKQAEKDVVTEIINGITNVGLLVFGLYLVRESHADIGSIVAVISLQSGLTYMFSSLGGFFANMQNGLSNVRRVFDLLSQEEEKAGFDIPQSGFSSPNTVISLDGLRFSYDKNNYVLKDVNLNIKRNEFVALVGLNGSGKSTLIKILLGFYQPEGGISLCNRSFGEYTLEEIRKRIAYVQQNPVMFNASIRENILFGKAEATEEEFLNAAKMANVLEFVEKLEDGFDTIVGENGVLLSGGQKQRIAIARALIKNADILLLDEATSALDAYNEMEVMEAICNIVGKRTVLMITHHLNSIPESANIVLLEQGQIVEEGNHDSLMAKNGKYAGLYNMQMSSIDLGDR